MNDFMRYSASIKLEVKGVTFDVKSAEQRLCKSCSYENMWYNIDDSFTVNDVVFLVTLIL